MSFDSSAQAYIMFLSSPRNSIARLIHQISGQKCRLLNVIFAYTELTFCLAQCWMAGTDPLRLSKMANGKITHNEMTKQNARTATFILNEKDTGDRGGVI